ncbi:MAG: PDZ domain-containing protein [Actinomycetales bacterium]|nr:PDZ domain-containing protein [Actinomycetales bacterium]
MTTPTQGSGPISYPESQPYAMYPPLDSSADRPPLKKKRGPGAGVVVGLIAGAGLIAVTAGTIGGGVGYLVARETLPASASTVAAGAAVPALPSVVPGSIADIAAAVQPAVVQLNVSGSAGQGTGSGFVISKDGYIITNNHVAGVAAGGGSIDVQFSDGTTKPGRLIGASPDYDIAVVKVDGTNLATVPLGSSADLAVGDSVIAVGSPLGLSGTVTTGIVSALNRPVTAGGEGTTAFINAIQTDAAINPGNSGGPLLDGNGQVIGVNSAIASLGAGAGGQAGSIGLGFAIPIDTAKRIADEIMKTGSAVTPVIGVQLDMNYTGPGAQIADVTAGSGAAQAGLQAGDIITAIDGKAITDPTELVVTIRSYAPGDTLNVTAERNGQSAQYSVTLQSATP